MRKIDFSLIIPVYRNELNIPELLKIVKIISGKLQDSIEVLFIVDGSPDKSHEILSNALKTAKIYSKLVLLSRNFGSFSAIRAGLNLANGKYFAVMAADQQEPPELIVQFFTALKKNEADVIIGKRKSRSDPFFAKLSAKCFWYLYRKFIFSEMPSGGIDVFGCNKIFRDTLLTLRESHSSLIAQIFWLGFRRKTAEYERAERKTGVSGWTLKKKIDYMMDSIFAFTSLPVKLLTAAGAAGIILFGGLGLSTFISRLLGIITVPGYTALFLAIGFFGALNVFGIGIIGSYAWRTYENTKNRPESAVLSVKCFNTDKWTVKSGRK